MTAFYNEIDPYAAQWLRNLIAAGHIAPGVVDERSIEDIHADELASFTQCHFFAGLGGWSYALRLAGWDDSRPCWTGSCPCQPFSAAGKGHGFADERHLWPAWFHLIGQCQPPVIFGEQVASKDADPWIDLVQADLEAMGYAVGCVPFPAAGIGAPHIRDRSYWLAHADNARLEGWRVPAERAAECLAGSCGVVDGMADSDSRQCDGLAVVRGVEHDGQDAGRPQGGRELEPCGDVRGMADAYISVGGQGRPIDGRRNTRGNAQSRPGSGGRVLLSIGQPGPVNGLWGTADWLRCRDGKWRPVEPGTFPLADGLPGRVGRLRAYGNAINPWQAAELIAAYAEARGLTLSTAQAGD